MMSCGMFFMCLLCCTTHKAACGIETKWLQLLAYTISCCTTHKAACGIETLTLKHKIPIFERCTTHKAACGMGAPIGSLRSPLPP